VGGKGLEKNPKILDITLKRVKSTRMSVEITLGCVFWKNERVLVNKYLKIVVNFTRKPVIFTRLRVDLFYNENRCSWKHNCNDCNDLGKHSHHWKLMGIFFLDARTYSKRFYLLYQILLNESFLT
jgi:hypothetical protein